MSLLRTTIISTLLGAAPALAEQITSQSRADGPMNRTADRAGNFVCISNAG